MAGSTEPPPVAAPPVAAPELTNQPAAREPGARAETAAEEHGSEQLELTLMGVSSLIALLGIGLATWLWLKNPEQPARIAASMPGLHRLLLNKYYVDELYDVVIVRGVLALSRALSAFDRIVIDGIVNGVAQVTRLIAQADGAFDRYVVDGAVHLAVTEA